MLHGKESQSQPKPASLNRNASVIPKMKVWRDTRNRASVVHFAGEPCAQPDHKDEWLQKVMQSRVVSTMYSMRTSNYVYQTCGQVLMTSWLWRSRSSSPAGQVKPGFSSPWSTWCDAQLPASCMDFGGHLRAKKWTFVTVRWPSPPDHLRGRVIAFKWPGRPSPRKKSWRRHWSRLSFLLLWYLPA